MNELQLKNGEQLLQELISKAWDDNNFKNDLISEPEVTIERTFGSNMVIPEGCKIVVEDQSDPNVIYLNIPRKINIDDLELSDKQLEDISGGIFGIDDATFAVGVTIVLGAIQVLDWLGEGWNNYEHE